MILAALAVAFIGIFAYSQHSANKTSGNSTSAQPTSHIEGQGKSGVTLIEYGDYECPICGEYYAPLKQVVGQLSSQIYFQFRNLPLSAIHPNAFAGARAAEAASLQGKFWQMHDMLYENQQAWASSTNAMQLFDQYAKTIGLNISQFDSDFASSRVNDAINADVSVFGKTGQQQATPTFFLDGTYIDNSKFSVQVSGRYVPSASKIAQVIQDAINSKAKH